MQTLLNNCSPAPALYESIIELATTVLFMAVANYRSRWSPRVPIWTLQIQSQLGVGGVSSGANRTRNRIRTLHLVQRHLTGFSPMVSFWGTAPKPVHLHNWIVFARFSVFVFVRFNCFAWFRPTLETWIGAALWPVHEAHAPAPRERSTTSTTYSGGCYVKRNHSNGRQSNYKDN